MGIEKERHQEKGDDAAAEERVVSFPLLRVVLELFSFVVEEFEAAEGNSGRVLALGEPVGVLLV